MSRPAEQPYCRDCGMSLHPHAEKAIGSGEWAMVWADFEDDWVCRITGDEHVPSGPGDW